ncbi:50S ribosomal protein L10 [candidate division KSB1 bacterium]|nr:50S ribosomal protein L10 [candidate division KSB1 bacterium]NIR70249.1 50S ribosomal protein L10 [candidate division KSB1 bacterium]NIS26520.1 50S ribosomal protein L10 [candidate division KSB1 bacterium]NIT73282.1 50S ribosomal protein L10 [candidate division KSB1 bacterium]NIU23906.1 50S ribosomal protein L10 [candidate division KSB1 bacterium]
MPKAEKIARVEELSKKLDEASSVFLTDFTGLNVQDIDELRRTFSAASVRYEVVKNTLARLSVQEAGCDGLLEFLEGPTAMAFGTEDPAAPARVIKEYSKKNENLKFKAGLFDGVLIGADQIDEIANLPTKEVLLSRLAGALGAPLSNLAGSLNGILSGLATVIDAVRQQKEESNS